MKQQKKARLARYRLGTPIKNTRKQQAVNVDLGSFDPGPIDLSTSPIPYQLDVPAEVPMETLQPKPVVEQSKRFELNPQKQQVVQQPTVVNGRNVIPEQLQGINNPNVQKYVDDAKQSLYPFLVDDYYYRASKLHPEITKEQVANAYNSVPYLAGGKYISNSANSRGRYRPQERGEDTNTDYAGGYIRINPENWKTYNDLTKRDGDIIFGHDQIPFDQIMMHETGHMYDDYLYGDIHRTNSYEDALLEDAYRGILGNDVPIEELRQINRELRGKIHLKNKNAIGNNLDDAIKNTKNNALQWMIDAEGNGYVNKTNANMYLNSLKKSGKYEEQMDKIRRAMMEVAQQNNSNPYQQMYNPVQLYAPSINQNYEMA